MSMQNNKMYREEYYETHWNGGRPFMVGIHGDEVFVQDRSRFRTIAYCIPEKIFIGKDRSQGEYFDGNSILLHWHDLEYIFICEYVFTFTAKSPIIRFESPVGNSNVPYPYAIDIQGNVYLPVEDLILLKCDEMDNYTEMIRNGVKEEDYYIYYFSSSHYSSMGNKSICVEELKRSKKISQYPEKIDGLPRHCSEAYDEEAAKEKAAICAEESTESSEHCSES